MKKLPLLLALFLFAFTAFSQNISTDSLLKRIGILQDTINAINKRANREEAYNKINKDFQFSVGGNLDFLEKLKVDGLYYDVNFYLREPFKDTSNCKKKFLNRFGIEGRMLQGRLVNSSDTSRSRNNVYYTKIENNDTSMYKINQNYDYFTSSSPKYLILNLMPTFRLTKVFDKDEDTHIGLYLVFYSEYFRNNRNTRIKYEVLNQDTTIIDFDSIAFSRPSRVVDTFPVNINIIDNYFNNGLGIKFLYENKYMRVDVDPIFGLGKIKVSNIESIRGMFYSVSTEIAEKKFGFKIGARVTGTYRGNLNPLIANNNQPRVYVYFAKTFSFAAIGNFLKGE